MNKIEVKDKLMLDELYKDSALTLEGLAPTDENLQELKNGLKIIPPLRGRIFTLSKVQ